jgi:hypothetical protein
VDYGLAEAPRDARRDDVLARARRRDAVDGDGR